MKIGLTKSWRLTWSSLRLGPASTVVTLAIWFSAIPVAQITTYHTYFVPIAQKSTTKSGMQCGQIIGMEDYEKLCSANVSVEWLYHSEHKDC